MQGIGFIILAAILDVLANRVLELSKGFSRPLWGILALLLVGFAFFLLEKAVEYMNLAVAYASWGAIGILGTAIVGHVFLKQHLSVRGKVGIGLILCSIIILRLGA